MECILIIYPRFPSMSYKINIFFEVFLFKATEYLSPCHGCWTGLPGIWLPVPCASGAVKQSSGEGFSSLLGPKAGSKFDWAETATSNQILFFFCHKYWFLKPLWNYPQFIGHLSYYGEHNAKADWLFCLTECWIHTPWTHQEIQALKEGLISTVNSFIFLFSRICWWGQRQNIL